MGLRIRATRLAMAILASAGLNAWANEPEAIPGEYIVKMRTPVSEDKSALQAMEQRLGAHIKSAIPSFNMIVIQRPVFETTKSVLKTLAEDSLVEYVEPNYVYRINRRPNDPMLGQLWGMENTQNPGVDIGAVKAWALETGNQDLVVAVIDTGINYNHSDLKANLWVNAAEANGLAGVDDDGNGVIDDIYGFNAITGSGDPIDDHGHGSHCSGTIGAKGDDGKGIVGVAWNVRLMGVKFLSASGGGSLEGAIKSIDYATKMGAKILSNSWGGGGFSQALKEAIDRSHAAGVVFVAAAGNESNNNDSKPTYPATYDSPNIISVAAVDSRGQLASFSNYGKNKVHVAAPGVNVLSSINTEGYDSWSGTSMAAPHVSGIAALLLSREPNLSNIEVRDRIITTSQKWANLRSKVRAGGIANAYATLTNQVAGPDPDDPTNWASVPVSVSSPHPYGNNASHSYRVQVPGAQQISLYLEKFDTERRYDTLTVKDSTGKIVEELSGNLDDSFTAIINGDTAILEFKSDNSVNRYGFDITRAAWR